jgi:hypothetical protein
MAVEVNNVDFYFKIIYLCLFMIFFAKAQGLYLIYSNLILS